MIESLVVLAICAFGLAALSFVLARVVPDDYDKNNPRLRRSPAPARAPSRPSR